MFERNVKLPDGNVYSQHSVTSALIGDSEQARVIVESTGDAGTTSTQHYVAGWGEWVDEALAHAEELIMELPAFAEYQDPIDDILPILTDEQAEQVPQVFPQWALNHAYAQGDRVRYDGGLFKCLQAHTSQEGWEPDKAVSLWVAIIEPPSPDVPPEWVQPTGAHDAYAKGDKVTHNEKVWVSDIDANVYEPGVYGWTEFVEGGDE